MIHSSYFKPKIFPYLGDVAPAEIDRLQDLSGSISLNREKIKEIGRDGIVDWRKKVPTLNLTARQLEYGSLEFFRKLANKSDATTSIVLNDFKTSQADIAAYKTDDDGTFLGTLWWPKLRTSGFGINIGDPEAIVERSFSLVGEDEIVLLNNNKYFVYLTSTATGGNHQIVFGSGGYVDYPDPVEDQDNSGTYLFRVLRVRSTTTTELVLGTDYTYDTGTTTITFPGSVSQSGDVFKVYYSASSYITAVDPFTENDSDLAAISADSASIILSTSDYVYRLQSVAVDVTLDRTDTKEIGNDDVVARGVREKTVRITLGRLLEAYSIEQVLRGVSSTYGKLDAREYLDNNTLRIKLYSDSDKGTFKMGYKFIDLAPTSLDAGATIDEYISRGTVLEGEDCTISSLEATIDG